MNIIILRVHMHWFVCVCVCVCVLCVSVCVRVCVSVTILDIIHFSTLLHMQVLFTQFQHSDQSALPPDVLRNAMADCYQVGSSSVNAHTDYVANCSRCNCRSQAHTIFGCTDYCKRQKAGQGLGMRLIIVVACRLPPQRKATWGHGYSYYVH